MFQPTRSTDDRFLTLRRLFLLLNSAYGHWQLLDDVAYFAGDTHTGMMTAPGYLLVSQGKLAKRLLSIGVKNRDCFLNGCVQNDAIRYNNASCLRIEMLACPKSHHGIEAQDETTLAAYEGLANSPEDQDLPLAVLCCNRTRQAEKYFDAMSARLYGKAMGAVAESGTLRRIVRAVHNDAHGDIVRAQFREVRDPFLLETLRILNLLMNRAYRRAARLASTA